MLDDLSALRKADPQDMLSRISELPEQSAVAWIEASAADLPPGYGDIDNVVIFGMGGSAIGADLVRALLERSARAPITLVRDYHAPAWVGPRTLAIAMSHSGSTEETLSAIQEAIAAGAKPLAVTGGGELVSIISNANGAIVPVNYKSQPRAAIAHLFLPLLHTLMRLNLAPNMAADLAAALQRLRHQRDRLQPGAEVATNEAKQLAVWLADGLPVFVGAGHLGPVATRWKGQVNENSKGWAVVDTLPEMDHNTVVGFPNPKAIASAARVVFLDSPRLNDRIRQRIKITGDLLDQAGVQHRTIEAGGPSALADQLTLIQLGDWTSYYAATIRGVDPTPVAAIDILKAALAKRG